MLISYHNWLNDPGGSWIGTPSGIVGDQLVRLLSVHAGEPGIATAPADSYSIRRRFSATPKPVGMVALASHNMRRSESLTIVVRLWDQANQPDTPVWESTAGDIYVPPVGFERDLLIRIPPDPEIVATDLEVTCSGTFDSDVAAVGSLWAGPVWYPPEGSKWEWTAHPDDATEMRLTPGRQGYADDQQVYKVLTGGIDLLTLEQAYGNADNSILDVQLLGHLVARHRFVIVAQRFDTPHMLNRTGLRGYCPSGIKVRHVDGDRYSTEPVRFEQLF